LAASRLIASAQDVSDGGLAVAITECCFDTGGQGCEVNLPVATGTSDITSAAMATLFGESAGQIVVSAAASNVDAVLAQAKAVVLPARVIVKTGGSSIVMKVDGQPAIEIAVREAEDTWATSIARKLARP